MIDALIFKNSVTNEIFNIGNSSEEVTIYQLVKICHKILNKKLFISKKINKSIDSPKRRVPNMSKTYKYTKYKAQINLHEGIIKTKKWLNEI